MENGDLPTKLPTLISSAKSLLQRGDFAGVESLLANPLEQGEVTSAHSEALYLLAVAQRYQKKSAAALATLARLQDIDAAHARSFQERGYNLLALQQPAEALEAFERAVALNPALLASWKTLVPLYRASRRLSQSSMAQKHADALEALPRELLGVSSMIHENELHKADRLVRHFLKEHPQHVEAMRLLADIGVRAGVLDDAEFLLESCVEFAPEFELARFDYANVLLRRQKFERAHEQARWLADRDPENLAVHSLLGAATLGIGDNEAAIRIFDEVIARSPGQSRVLVMRGHALKTMGRADDAIASYRKAYEVDPAHGDAFWSLANLKVYSFSDAEIAHMETQEAAPATSDDDRAHLLFSLGKAYEDRADYQQSFHFYERGNALKQKNVRHRVERVAYRTQAQIDICDEALFHRRKDVGCPAPDPIFVVGLPRAGSTLLEQILASHSQVDGTLELPNVLSLVNRLRGRAKPVDGELPQYPSILRDLDPDYFREFGEQFLKDTQVFRKGAPRFIDKMPNNFFHIGLIRLILPNAKIIDARRHPMACCFSGFKQLFGEGQEFSYGLTEIGHYYRQYVMLMDHWEKVLPGFVLRVQHEDVVDDLEQQVRRVLDFCDLPFEEACLRFHETDRDIRTPSSEQVRQPIYRSGLEHWRHYEPWLAPLKQALGPELLESYNVSPA